MAGDLGIQKILSFPGCESCRANTITETAVQLLAQAASEKGEGFGNQGSWSGWHLGQARGLEEQGNKLMEQGNNLCTDFQSQGSCVVQIFSRSTMNAGNNTLLIGSS